MNNQQAPVGETVRDGGAESPMSDAAELFKAVAHPVRAQILELLCRGESSIPELCEGTGAKPAHLSRHLTQMRGQHLIRGLRVDGRLIYRLAYPEAADLLAAARSVLHARTAAAAGGLDRMGISATADAAAAEATGTSRIPEAARRTAPSDEFSALEASLASRSVIGDACEVIAARNGCSVETAARRLIMTARSRNITLLQAAGDELRNQEYRAASRPGHVSDLT